MAEIHTILANGGVAKGKRFMSEAGCRKALELQVEGKDLILDVPARFGLGFGLVGGVLPLPEPEHHLLGRLRRLADHHRHGCPHHLRLRHEQDGRHDHRATCAALGLAMAMWTAMGTISARDRPDCAALFAARG